MDAFNILAFNVTSSGTDPVESVFSSVCQRNYFFVIFSRIDEALKIHQSYHKNKRNFFETCDYTNQWKYRKMKPWFECIPLYRRGHANRLEIQLQTAIVSNIATFLRYSVPVGRQFHWYLKIVNVASQRNICHMRI